MAQDIPTSILIVGAGEFGLSTALALLNRPAYSKTHITLLESSHGLPNPSGSSVDSSRIIRADYACKPYAQLAAEAQTFWRDQSATGWGGEGRYAETGFVLTADDGADHYVREAMDNVQNLAKAGCAMDISKIEQLNDKAAIQRATGHEGVSGDKGYANWNSGWAHAQKVVEFALGKVSQFGKDRITIRTGCRVQTVQIDNANQCHGVILDSGERINADVTLLAAGAWTPSLIDLEGRCLSTGQALAYLKITPEEQAAMGNRPVIMNLSRGIFIIPPTGQELKIARHAYGYQNPQRVTFHDGTEKLVSVPKTGISVPPEGVDALRSALQGLIPSMGDRPFTHTRLCYYTDTPCGDFIVDYHPDHPGLFVATGGSGHGFKFFPILGEKIVDRLENKLSSDLTKLWRWPPKVENFTACEDGSRSGTRGLTLDER